MLKQASLTLPLTCVRRSVGFNWVSWWNSAWRNGWRALDIFKATVEMAAMATRCPSVRLLVCLSAPAPICIRGKEQWLPLLSPWSISFCLPPTSLTHFNLKWYRFLSLPAAQFPLSGRRASSRGQVRWMFLNAERVRWILELRDVRYFAICSLFLFLQLQWCQLELSMKSENTCWTRETGNTVKRTVQGHPPQEVD